MLYQIEGTQTRMLGTLHIVPSGKQEWVEYVRRCYKWSERVVVEMKPANAIQGLRSDAGDHDRVPADLLNKVKARWKEDRFGPLASTSLMGIYLMYSATGLACEIGVEGTLATWMTDPESAGEIETPTEFANAFRDIPAEEFVGALRQRVGADAKANQVFAQIYRAWRGNSGEKLAKLLRTGMPERIRACMFDKRNETWAPRLKNLAESPDRTLICIGAGHLHGAKNVRELLRANYGLSCIRIEP